MGYVNTDANQGSVCAGVYMCMQRPKVDVGISPKYTNMARIAGQLALASFPFCGMQYPSNLSWILSASTPVVTLRQQGLYPLRYLFLRHQTQGLIKNVCRDWGDSSGTKSAFWANIKALTQIPSTPTPAPMSRCDGMSASRRA